MSQWGEEVRIDGARFVPSVDSAPFTTATRDNPVTFVLLIDDGGNTEKARRVLAELQRQAVGQTYGNWLDMKGTWLDMEGSMRRPNTRI